jgi:ABC-type sugar transport system ATPase subunit
MATNFAEMSPQERGIIVVNAQANLYPDGSAEQQKLLGIRNDGLAALEAMGQPQNGQFSPQGRLNSRRQRLSPQEQADKVAKQMLEAGKTPQEIGAVVAAILGFKS